MTFTVHTDPNDPERRWVTVDHWTSTDLLSPEMIGQEHAGASVRLEGTVRFVVANGEATYRVTGWDRVAQAFAIELIEARRG